MDAAAFEAVSDGDDPLTLSELVGFFDDELRLPVAGAVAIVRHLLRLALLVWTLAACVVLYCFALAWLCLFWTQTRLFKYTTKLLDSCMSTTPVADEAKLCSSTPSHSTQKAKDIISSKISAHKKVIAAIPHSGLAAEAHRAPGLQEERSPARLLPSAGEHHGHVDIDEEDIAQEILHREKELEAEIQELVTSHGTEWDCKQSNSPEIVASSQDALSGCKSNGSSITVDTSVHNHHKQSEDCRKPVSNSVPRPEPPQAATFKLAKAKINVKPRINYAEQLKEKKAQEQMSFVNSLSSNSTLSTNRNNDKGRTTDAEHLKAQWSGENVAPLAGSKILTAIAKTPPSSSTFAVPQGPKHQLKREATKPTPISNQASATLPPHVRKSLEAKAKRAAAEQLAYEETLKVRDAVPTDNPFAALSDDALPADVELSPQDDGNNADIVHLVDSGTRMETASKSPSAPEPPNQTTHQQDVVSMESSDVPRSEHQDGLPDTKVGPRRVYTLESLKATKSTALETQGDDLTNKIEAAAELVAFHAQSGRASRSPKKKPLPSRWNNFDGTKEHPPTSDGSSKCLLVAEVDEAISRPDGSPFLPQDRHDSAVTTTIKEDPAKASVCLITEPVIDISDTIRTSRSTSSNLELMGLEFGTSGLHGKPPLRNNTREPSRSLPITPGPLPFFAPIDIAKENVAAQHSVSPDWNISQKRIAYNPFAPGPFQSNAFHHNEAPQHFPPQQSGWIEPDVHVNQHSFYLPHQKLPMTDLYSPVAPYYAYSDPRIENQPRQSLAVPVAEPVFDISSEEAFPSLGAHKPVRDKMPGPPGLGPARIGSQASFDALLPAAELPSKRPSNLGKFISTATTSSASLDRTQGKAVYEVGPVATAFIPQSLPLADHREALAKFKPPQTTEYDSTFPELPKVSVPDMQAGDMPGDKNMKREKKKIARDILKDSWYERELSRKKLSSSFSLEGANDLKHKTRVYHEKRSVLRSLMSSGALNPQDTEMFPEFGSMDLRPPKVNALSSEDWLSRKRQLKPVVAEATNAAPVASTNQFDNIKSALKDMITAQGHRDAAMDRLQEPRPQSNIAYETWLTQRNQTCARADKLYCRKRKILVAACPAGLPPALEMRFPDISQRG